MRLSGMLLAGLAMPVAAQQAPEPQAPPPAPPPTTVVEPGSPIPPTPEPGPTPRPTEETKTVPQDASGIPLSTLETNDFSLLYFDPVQTFLTPYLGRAFENAIDFHKRKFNWKPWDRTTVLLKDFGDYGNAGARASPNNAVLLDVAPLSQSFETFTPGERFFTLINHELAHVATMDVWNRHDAAWRRLLHGKPMPIQEHPESILYNYLTTPRTNVPRWYLEGSAVFFETWMAGGLGRAQGAFDEMVFRAKVRDGERLYSPLGLESEGNSVDYQVGVNDYLYGTRFFSYLALTYGPERAVDWLRRPEGSAGFYSARFKQVFGKPLDQVWGEWLASERQFQQGNLARLAQYPLTPVTPLSPRGLGSISRGYVDTKTNSLVAAFRYPGRIGFVGTMDLATGKLRPLREIKGMMLYKVTSLAFDEQARTIFYTEDNYAFRDLIALNVDTGEHRMLLKDARIGDMVLNPVDRSLWGIRHQNGYATLVRIPAPYTSFNQVHTFDYGQIPFDLDISPDGALVSSSFGEIDGKQSVRVWKRQELQDGLGPIEVTRLELPPSTPEGFVFTPDGKSLIGSSYYTGVSNIYRFDLATAKWAVVSNASTGFFRPLPQPDGSLIVYDYSGQGLRPVRIVPKVQDDLGTIQLFGTKVVRTHPELQSWGVGSPAKIDLDPLVTGRGRYDPGKRMRLAGAYPIVEGYRKTPVAGYLFHWEDPMQFRQVTATVGVSPLGERTRGGERLHLDVQYKTLAWKLRYRHNGADFYDLFGPVERSRKGDIFTAEYVKSLTYDPPRQLELFGNGGVYLGLDRLPGAQNIVSPRNIVSVEGGLRFHNLRKSLGSVDREKGLAWQVSGGVDRGGGVTSPKLAGSLDVGVPLPLPNSSAWLYAAAGSAWGKAASPLSNFYFGSFRNNYVDDRPEKRYRETEAFPGFEIDGIAARRYAKLIGEVNLPPVRFAEVGTPSFYLSSLRPALFGGTLLTRDPAGGGRRFGTVGGQLDLNFTVALRLPMIVSVGAAHGFGRRGEGRTETMISLKIM
ncbi:MULTISPECIES: TolB family protein [Sphingomonas]|uniref:TolB family protein n=1 Tax=Sphingomonas TaxID=13687 RepID=UPI00126A413E|nr:MULTISPECIES: hypothetical protein [Sphingomonas]